MKLASFVGRVVSCVAVLAAVNAGPILAHGAHVAPPTEPQELVLHDVGFRFEVPAGWMLREPMDGPFAAIAELPPKQALLLLTRQTVSADEPEGQGVENLLAELPQAFTEHQIVSMERRQLAGDLHADVIEVLGNARGRELHHTTYLLEGHGERFILTFATENFRLVELRPVFKDIASTLEFSGPNLFNRRFHDLIRNSPDDLMLLQAALDEGADVNALDGDGFTAIVYAVLSRNGRLVQWLLQNGANPKIPEKMGSMLPMLASPPILELLIQADPNVPSSPRRGQPKALKIEWVSPEAQLFVGIKEARLFDVEEALAKGADLAVLDRDYELAALPLVRELIREFQELGLDPERFFSVETLLVEAAGSNRSIPASEGPELSQTP